jgi:DNA-directed RNA polymerase specialized sigma24 family protein
MTREQTDDRDRLCLQRRREGLTYAQISKRMGMPQQTARFAAKRAEERESKGREVAR